MNNKDDDGFITIINNKRSSYKMILEDYRNGKISIDDAENMLNNKKTYNYNNPYYKVTKNGMIALYNITYKPIVLYSNQWKKLLNFLDDGTNLYNFMNENNGQLKKLPSEK